MDDHDPGEPKPWRLMTFAERAIWREAESVKDAAEARRAAEAKRESDAVHAQHERPRTRGDCVDGPRPCAYVACKHHLYLDVNPVTGKVKLNFPDLEVDQLEHSCALDLAERGGMTLTEVGDALNLTRERVRQIEMLGERSLRWIARGLRGT